MVSTQPAHVASSATGQTNETGPRSWIIAMERSQAKCLKTYKLGVFLRTA